MSPKWMLTLLAALAVLVALPAGAHAQKKVNVAVGIGDQNAPMFDDPAFLQLRIKKARYFISWNAIDDPRKLALADEWLAGAKRRGVRPLFHLDGVFTDSAPSVSEYRTKVKALVDRYRRQGVREWGVWNEANSRTQPVVRLASRTAQYFLALRRICRGCTIVALDLLDAGNIKGYIRAFYRKLGRKKRLASIVGIHNYGDTNRTKNNTGVIIREVRRYNRRAKFWMTETGGIALLQTEQNGRLVASRGLGCDPENPATAERRQARAVAKMFRLARKYRRHVTRLYPFSFYSTDCDLSLRFDAGLVRRDGSRRPAYNTLRRAMRSFKR
ncbi:MAG: hypothetical protein M3320_03810 [Actinomycetota bacterium]|nr:hypothetical protein [Actinomycetota bacterium]MDQ5807781.1 hypothetical protein [Actinomycetota bacterium]